MDTACPRRTRGVILSLQHSSVESLEASARNRRPPCPVIPGHQSSVPPADFKLNLYCWPDIFSKSAILAPFLSHSPHMHSLPIHCRSFESHQLRMISKQPCQSLWPRRRVRGSAMVCLVSSHPFRFISQPPIVSIFKPRMRVVASLIRFPRQLCLSRELLPMERRPCSNITNPLCSLRARPFLVWRP